MKTRELPVFPLTGAPVRSGTAAGVLPMHPGPAVTGGAVGVGFSDGPRIALVTLGCDKNTVDSERMMAALVGNGARVSDDVEGAEVVIVNTCGFIEAARTESIETILEACAMKESSGVRAVVAVGCMVQRYGEELAREIPEVDLFMGLTELQGLVPELRHRELLPPEDALPTMERPLRILSSGGVHTSFLKISEGCDHTCAFCAIPLMRGLHRSHPLEALVQEAEGLAAGGVREVNIISQDTTWYGRDARRRDPDAPLLPELLDALLDRTTIEWYRLFYMYPSGITPEVVERIADGAARTEGPRIVPYLDMPLQHGSDRILAAMRRPERRATIRERVAWLRDAIPDLTLRTTVIVGFPGETDEDFDALVDLIEEVRFDRVGAFTWSPEEGTRAVDLPDRVPDSLARERLEQLMDLQRGISAELNEDRIGEVTTAIVDELFDEEDEHGFVGVAHAESQAIDVDGVTHLVRGAEVEPGALARVEIVDAEEHDLIGRVVAW
ncbi:MAG: 30S ribosomal protein S12 methylthiotransferase RimO [Longimicrobiales bacterium]|nr:30S ribosomal protein S12 methylthiotransferase RimO [Longimicrobiales bacterium]